MECLASVIQFFSVGRVTNSLCDGKLSWRVLASNTGLSSQILNQVLPVPAAAELAAGVAGVMYAAK